MVYYADGESSNSAVWVGWLDKAVPFSTGATDSAFLEELLKLYRHRTKQTRGYHLCPFCSKAEVGVPLDVGGQQIKLGSAEIHVKGSGGRTFVAPDLVYHYIVAHGYRPPTEFIEAVCSSPCL
jgi:hypothetical protein